MDLSASQLLRPKWVEASAWSSKDYLRHWCWPYRFNRAQLRYAHSKRVSHVRRITEVPYSGCDSGVARDDKKASFGFPRFHLTSQAQELHVIAMQPLTESALADPKQRTIGRWRCLGCTSPTKADARLHRRRPSHRSYYIILSSV